MTDMPALLLENEFALRLGWGLLHSLWQIAVLAGLYYLARLAIPKRFLSLRYHLGYGVLLLMFALPVATAMLMPLPDFSQANVVNPSRDGDGAGDESVEFGVGSLELKETETQNNSMLDMNALPFDSRISGAVSMAEFIDLVGEDAVAQAFREAEGNIPSRDGDGAVEANLHSRVPLDDSRGSDFDNAMPFIASKQHIKTVLTICSQHLWVLTLLWLAGVIFLSTRLTLGLLGIGRMRRSARPPVDDEWYDRLAELCRSLQVRQNVQLLVSRAIDSPVLIGMFRPAILVPLSFLSGFTPEEVEAILVHELAHVRRHDYLANLVQMLIETLLFYHPMLWLVSNAVREDREYICDEFVVRRHGTDSIFYAKTLTNLEQFRQTGGNNMKHTLYTPAAAARPLLNRVRHILGLKKESDRTCGGMAGLTLLIVLMLSPLCFALLQEDKPSAENFAQTSDFGPQASEAENSLQEENSTLHTPNSKLPAEPGQSDTEDFFGGIEGFEEFYDVSVATEKSEPVTTKLYLLENALKLFELDECIDFIETTIQVTFIQDQFDISRTKRNALMITTTDFEHKRLATIMAEIDAIVESEEFMNSREMNAAEKPEIKVFKIKHTTAPSLMAIFQSLQIDPQMLLSMDVMTNSVLIKATPETLEIVEDLITQLDTEPEPSHATNRTNYYSPGGGYGYAATSPVPTQTYPPFSPSHDGQGRSTVRAVPPRQSPQYGTPDVPSQYIPPTTRQAVPSGSTTTAPRAESRRTATDAAPTARPQLPQSGQTQSGYPAYSPTTPYHQSTQQAVPATPNNALPVIQPNPGVQFMTATPAQPAAATMTVSPGEGESGVQTIYRVVPETRFIGPGTPLPTPTFTPETPKTVTITRKVQEITPEGETIEREVTEEVSVESVRIDSHPVTPEVIPSGGHVVLSPSVTEEKPVEKKEEKE